MTDAAFSAARPITCVIGMGLDDLRGEFGSPKAQQRQGDDTWLIFHFPSYALRIRCSGEPDPAAGSCTATLTEPASSLQEAAEPLGLWPACRPDVDAASVSAPLVRRGLTGPSGELLSMTATVRAGRFSQVTVFDEEPEWLDHE